MEKEECKHPIINKIGKKYYWGSLNLTRPINQIIQEAKKEVFDNIDKLYNGDNSWKRYNAIKQRHLSTFPDEQKQHNYRKKNIKNFGIDTNENNKKTIGISPNKRFN